MLPQALLAGRPVISYDIDGAREVVRNDDTGYLCPTRPHDDIGNARLSNWPRRPGFASSWATPVANLPHAF